MSIGKRIRYAREKKALSRKDVANYLGISVRRIENIEYGAQRVQADLLPKISQYLECSLNFLVNGKEEHVIHPSLTSKDMSLPLYGLSECGNGIYKATHAQISISREILLSEQAYGVIAVGDSLTPMGISAGMICYCEPKLSPVRGDIIHIVRKDEISLLKRFDTYMDISGHQAIAVTGWLESEQGTNEDFACDQTIQPSKYIAEKLDIDMKNVKSIAPVVYIKRKV